MKTNCALEYGERGYVLLCGAVSSAAIDELLENKMTLASDVCGGPFSDPNGPDLIDFYDKHRDLESQVYTGIRQKPWLEEFSKQPGVIDAVRQILGSDIGMFRKIVFRMDMPNWTEELAHWHQDFFYVKGNVDVVTAWIPLQDTTFLNGCISVMPGSHSLGAVEHDIALGKKRIPSSIFNREVKMIEMKKGDALLFSSLLLHSGNLNLSDTIRYSVQPRFTRLSDAVDDGMGGVVAL